MNSKIKWSWIVPALLLAYLAVMAWMGRGLLVAHQYLHYFGVIVIGLVIIVLVHVLLRRWEQRKAQLRAEQDEAEYGTYADHPDLADDADVKSNNHNNA